MSEYIQTLLDKRANAWEQAKEILEREPDAGKRSEEDKRAFERANADMDTLGRQADEWLDNARMERELATAREAVAPFITPEEDNRRGMHQASAIERFMRGQSDSATFDVDLTPAIRTNMAIRAGADAREVRAIFTDGGASAGSLVVPTTFVSQLYQYIEASSVIRQLSNVMTTASGNPMTFPRVGTHGIGTQVVAQGTAIGGTDPVFGTIRLDAFKYGQLVRVSTEAVADTGFDLLGFVAQNVGRAVGRITDTAYVLGSGSGAPNGIIAAASVGAKTGGSSIAIGGGAAASFTQTLDVLSDLQYSIVDEYRTNAVFVMNDLTAGTIRKVRDGGAGTIGAYIWTPSTTIDSVSGLRTPDRIFGSPMATDTNFGTQGSAVKSVAYGDWSAYYIRDSGSFRFERSDERYFDTDEIGFRGILRTDADLIDTGAIKTLQQLL